MTRKKKTNEQFLSEVYNLVGDEYTFLEEYQGNKTKLKVKHNKCGNVYEVSPAHFLRGQRCSKCHVNTLAKTNEDFKNEVYDLVGDEYTFLEPYVNTHTKIKVKHNKCGNIYKVSPAHFLRGQRCPNCSNNFKKTTQQFKDEVYNLVGGKYSVLGQYTNAKVKIKMKHNVCNNIYEVTPTNFLTGYRCPICSQSKGEDKIKEYLDNHQIKYKQYKRFDWLVFQGQQHLDFYLDEYNVAIEYDGKQHFGLVNWTGNLSLEKQKQNLEYNQELDFNKDKLCYQHNIKLIRLPYWKNDSIDKILDKELIN